MKLTTWDCLYCVDLDRQLASEPESASSCAPEGKFGIGVYCYNILLELLHRYNRPT